MCSRADQRNPKPFISKRAKFDSFVDPIKDRLLAPKRLGHIGLIKEEVVMAFRKNGEPNSPRGNNCWLLETAISRRQI